MGVWNGWGYGIAFFWALNFQISEPEIWQKVTLSEVSAEFQGFSCKFRALKNIFRMAIPSVPADQSSSLFGAPTFSVKRPKTSSASKVQIATLHNANWEGRYLCHPIERLQIGGRQPLFGGWQNACWRVAICILEAEIILGALHRKAAEPPKTAGTFGFRETGTTENLS